MNLNDEMSSMASCEPSPFLRDRIANDLRIKGQISFPQKIDMRALIPVYNFQSSEPFVSNNIAGLANVGGTNALTIVLADMFLQNPLRDYGEHVQHEISILYDAAGRAALAGTTRTQVSHYRTNKSIQLELIGIAESTVTAAAGQAGRVSLGNIYQSRMGGNLGGEYTISPSCKLDLLHGLKLTREEGLIAVVTLSTFPANFPANTQIRWYSRNLVYGKGLPTP